MKTKAHPLHTELYRHIKAIDIGKIKEDDKELASSISGKLRTKALQTLEKYRNKLVLSAEDKGKNSALHFIEKTIELLRINSYYGKGKKANKLV